MPYRPSRTLAIIDVLLKRRRFSPFITALYTYLSHTVKDHSLIAVGNAGNALRNTVPGSTARCGFPTRAHMTCSSNFKVIPFKIFYLGQVLIKPATRAALVEEVRIGRDIQPQWGSLPMLTFFIDASRFPCARAWSWGFTAGKAPKWTSLLDWRVVIFLHNDQTHTEQAETMHCGAFSFSD